MSEDEVRAPSGRFIRPAWKRMPTQFEKAVAITLVLLQIALVWGLTFVIGLAPDEILPRLEKSLEQAGEDVASRYGRPLNSSTGDPKASSRVPASPSAQPVPDAVPASSESSYQRGRRLSGIFVAQIAKVAEKPGNRKMTMISSLSVAAAMVLTGVLVAFFSWRLRRIASALFGAGVFFTYAFIAARNHGLSDWTSAFVSLPPAFLGALVGWHLVVLVTCLQASTLLTVLCALPVVMIVGISDLQKAVPVLIAVWALFAGLVYVFMVRSLLISAWAMCGAWTLGQAVLIGTFGISGVVLPWEAFLATIAVLAVVAIVFQFRLARRAAEEAGALGAEPA